MIVARHTCYLSEDGSIHLEPREAASADAAWWWRTEGAKGCTVGEQSVADAVLGALEMDAALVERIMARYQSAMDDASAGKRNADKQKAH